jgi:hypothetical protein
MNYEASVFYSKKLNEEFQNDPSQAMAKKNHSIFDENSQQTAF